MKYIFFGTPEFSAIILEKLIDSSLFPVALVCNPDRPIGRKMIVTPPPTKEVVLRKSLLEIDVLQPEKINEEFLNKLGSYEADFYIVAAYAKILPAELLNIPKLGIIGVHPSLLPKLRGSSPIQSAILEGDTQTGVTLYLLDEKVDHGPILAKRELEFPVSPSTPSSGPRGNFQFPILSQKLAELAANLLVKTLPKFVKGEITPLLQNESKATFTKKFTTEDGYINIDELKNAINGLNTKTAEIIDRKIRALNPEPGVYTIIHGKRMKIINAHLENNKLIFGEIQFEGKKPTLFSQYQSLLS